MLKLFAGLAIISLLLGTGNILAQTTNSTPDWVNILISYGPGGIFALALATNKLYLPREVKEAKDALSYERTDHAKTKEELANERASHNETRAVVYTTLIQQVVPALNESTVALKQRTGR